MNIDAVKFNLGSLVYRKILPDVVGIVTGILFRPYGVCYYAKFADDDEETSCWEIELTTDKSFKVADAC